MSPYPPIDDRALQKRLPGLVAAKVALARLGPPMMMAVPSGKATVQIPAKG